MMYYSDEQLENLFDGDITSSVQQALIQCLFGAYRSAFDACKHFQTQEAKDLRGYYRWIQIRHEMRGLGDRFSSITATGEDYHTLISAGRTKLIACSNRDPGSPLRLATYRLKYANRSLDLFNPLPPPSDEDYIFTILEHGVDYLQPRQPSFAKILFITKDMEIAHNFNLFARHQIIVDSLRIPLGDTQEGDPDIRLLENDEKETL